MDYVTRPKERLIWIGITVVAVTAVIVLGFLTMHYKRECHELARQQEAPGEHPATESGPCLLTPWELARLKERGLADPLNALAEDLMTHPELIPYKGVMGGKMGFYSKKDIHLVTSRWVVATFEDGHVRGRMLLEYTVATEGKIYWRVLSAYLE